VRGREEGVCNMGNRTDINRKLKEEGTCLKKMWEVPRKDESRGARSDYESREKKRHLSVW